MQSTIFEAGETVRGLWSEVQNTQVTTKEGHLEITGAVKSVTREARTALGMSEEDKDEAVLHRLQEILLLASKSSEARSAVIGVAKLLKDLGTLGHAEENSALMQTARTVSNKVLQKMTKGPLSSLIMSIQNWLSEKLAEAHILPKYYREAIEKAQLQCQDAQGGNNPIQIRSLRVALQDLQQTTQAILASQTTTAAQIKFGKSLAKGLDRFIERLNWGIKLIDEAEDLEKEASIAFDTTEQVLIPEKKYQLGDHIDQLKALEQRAIKLVQKEVLPESVLSRIRIDLACCLAQKGEDQSTVHRLSKSIAPSLPRFLRSQIISDQSISVLNQAREQIHRQSGFAKYQEAIRLLTRLTLPQGDKDRLVKSKLTREQLGVVEEFFEWAIANPRLNEFLHEKYPKTPLEETLSSFTYVTLQQNQGAADGALKTMAGIFQEGGDIHQYCDMRDELQELWSKGPKEYGGTIDQSLRLLKTCKGLPRQEEILTLAAALKFPSDAPEWEARFSTAHKTSVDSLLEVVEDVLKLPEVEKKKSRDQTNVITRAQKERLDEVKEQLAQYKKTLANTQQLREKLITEAEHCKDKISVDQLRTLEHYSRIAPCLDLLPSKSKEHSDLIGKLQTQAKAAAEHIIALDDLMQTLPSYPPGTILLDDEILTKAFKGAGRVYSQMKLQSSGDVSILLRDLAEKGPFAVQPYFTGQRTHAAIIATHPDAYGTSSVCKAEVTGDFSIEPVGIAGSLTAVAYQPDFEKMLSQAGKDKLGKEWGDEYLSRFQDLYAKRLAHFLSANKKELSKIQNNCIRAAFAYIQKLPGTVQAIFKRYVPEEGEADKPQPLGTEDQDALAKFQTRMFCSELVTAITQAVIADVNKELNHQFGTKINFFNPMTSIQESEYSTMDPGSLEERIRSHYSIAAFPVITRTLLGQDYGQKK